MIQRTSLLLGLFLFCLSVLSAQDEGLFIKNAEVIDLEKGKTQKRDVLIHEGKIVQVGRNLNGMGLEVLEAEGLYLMPGLIDAHVHFFQSGGLYTRPDVVDLRAVVPYEQEVARNKELAPDFLERYLKAGITTVMDVGGPFQNYALRDQYNDGYSRPNIFVTGPLISTYQPEAFQIEDAPILKINSPEEARALVQKQLPYQPDLIKIWYIVLPGQSPKDNLPMVEATIEEAHKHRLPVAVHATQLLTAKLAVRAGADILVHSIDEPVDQELIDLIVEKQVPLIPTLTVHENYVQTFIEAKAFTAQDFALANPFVLGSLMDNAHLQHPNMARFAELQSYLVERMAAQNATRADNLKRLQDAGALIATGTDAGNIGTQHASSYMKELQYMQEAGLSNLEILRASTIQAAKVLDQYPVLGAIQEESMADMILLESNPLENLDALFLPKYVVKGGALYQTDSLVLPSPEDLAQQQLNAYNAGDIDAFLTPYADAVELYSFPDILLSTGKEKMKENYAGMFAALPDLHCELINRVVQGNTVIDQERITGLQEGKIIEAIAIYQVENGKIAKVYFIQE